MPRDKTVKKLDSAHSPFGLMGQKYLVSGKRVAMRIWDESLVDPEAQTARDYETVGYCLAGRVELHIEEQKVLLEPGDSWLVPRGAAHKYVILEPFKAVEATSPPAHVYGRDKP